METELPDFKVPSAPPDMDLLLSISSGLGSMHQDEDGNKVYVAEGDCLNGLRDLQRFLRKDDNDTRDVFFSLTGWDTARNDLLPIIVHYAHDHQLVINAFKVLTFLTMPINPDSAKPVMQLLTLQKIKEAVLQQADVLPVLLGEAADALSKHPRMNEDQQATLQVCLTLLRNLLAVPDTQVTTHILAAEAAQDNSKRNKEDSTTGITNATPTAFTEALDIGCTVGLHARMLHVLMESGGLDLLTAVAQHAADRVFKSDLSLFLGLMHEVLRGVDPVQLSTAQEPVVTQPTTTTTETLATAGGATVATRQAQAAGGGNGNSTPARMQPEAASNARDKRAAAIMQSLAAQEKARKAALLRQAPRLHSRDTGRYVRRHNEHTGAVYARAGSKANELPAMNVPPPIAGFKDGWRGGMEGGSAMQLPGAVAWKLRCWADSFTSSGAYNELMEVARKDAVLGLGISHMDVSDLCHFMRITRTFSALARLKQEQLNRQKNKGQHAASTGEGTTRSDAAPTEGAAAAASAAPSMFAGVSSTLGWPMLQLVLVTWLSQVDLPVKIKNWELQFCCVSVLRELLLVLEAAQASGHPHDAAAADKLQRRLLHDDLKQTGVLPVLSRCARAFKPDKCPRGHAVDMIMSLACVVRTLDRLITDEAGGFMVKRRKTGGGGRRPVPTPPMPADPVEPPNPGGEPAKEKADNEVEDENGQEGGKGEGEGGEDGAGADGGNDKKDDGQAIVRRDPLELLQEEEEEFSEVDQEAAKQRVAEVQYDLDKRLHQELAQPGVVKFLVIQGMAFYSHNSAPVNKAVASLLWRITSADGLNFEPMMYQLGVIRVMHKLLSDRDIRAKSRIDDYQDLLVLATKVTRGLFSKLCPPLAQEADVSHLLSKHDGAGVDGPNGEHAAAGKHEQQRSGSDSELEIEEDPEAVVQRAEVAEAAAQERAKKVASAVERENKVRRGISSMLFLDVLFWKPAWAAEEISADYYLPLKAELQREDKPAPRSKDSRGKHQTLQMGNNNGQPNTMNGGAADGDAEDAGNAAGATRRGLAAWDDDNDDQDGGLHHNRNAAIKASGGAAHAEQPVAAQRQQPRDLRAEHEQLRKLHLAKKAAKGAAGKGTGRGGLALSPALQEELVEEFQKLNAHKSNLDLLLDRLGDSWTKHQVMRALRALGFKFGNATDAQVSATIAKYGLLNLPCLHATSHTQLTHLKQLWAQYGASHADDSLQDAVLIIAAELTGGWTSRQVKGLLVKHGILGRAQKGAGKRSKGRDASIADQATISAAAALDEEVVRDAFARFQDEPLQDMLQLVASQLGDVPVSAVQYKLEELGLVAAKVKRGKSNKVKQQVPVDELRELYEQHKDLPDMLNRIAAALSVPLTAAQVAKLLTKCDIVRDEAAARKAARNAADRAQLVALYQRYHGHEDYLQCMADDMPGIVHAQQVVKLMRKHGLIEGGSKASDKRRGAGLNHLQPLRADGHHDHDDGDDMAVGGAAPCRACGRVPEPDADGVLQCLAAIKEASAGRWMGPKTAVDWIFNKLSAAEALWDASGAGSRMDYSLIMETEEDEAFFMTDYAQELLEAAGIRNDKADYYKIPGNADAAWRQRVRDVLNTTLTQLDTPQASELLVRFKDAQRQRQEQQEQEAEAAAERAAAVTAAVQQANRRTKGPAMGVDLQKGKGARGKRASLNGSGQATAQGNGSADEDASGDGRAQRATKPVAKTSTSPTLQLNTDNGGAQQHASQGEHGDGGKDGFAMHVDHVGGTQQQSSAHGAWKEDSGPAGASGLAVRKTAPSSRLARLSGQTVAVDSDSSSDDSSDEDSSDDDSDTSSSSAGSSSDDDKQDAARHKRKHHGKGTTAAAARRTKPQSRPAAVPYFDSSSSAADNDGADNHADNESEDERIVKKSRTVQAKDQVQPKHAARVPAVRSVAGLDETRVDAAEQGGRDAQKRPSAHRPGTMTATARSAALAALAAKRQLTTGSAADAAPATGALKPLNAHGGRKSDALDEQAGGAKRRRLVKPAAGQENAATAAVPAAGGEHESLEDLEDF